MAFKDLMKSDAVAISAPSNGFAETITYTPMGVAANAKSVNAFVVRGEMVQLPENPNVMAWLFRILVPIDATDGIATVTENRDRVSLPIRAGDAASQEFRVARIAAKDHMFWTLDVMRGRNG